MPLEPPGVYIIADLFKTTENDIEYCEIGVLNAQ
jgi:hypothetical protein